MLDVGVGAGRTAYFFANLTKEYVGIDYSEKMIKTCQQKFRNYSTKVLFKVCDARSLEFFDDHYFDFVLFSYNGIDYMNHEDRLRTLREIQRITASCGYFCFSTHNLNYAWKLFNFNQSRNPLGFLSEARRFILLRLRNKDVLKKLRNRRYAILNDGAHNFRLRTYYIKPKEQIEQLADLGFTNIRLYGLFDGKEIKPPFMFDCIMDPWVYYLCTARKK